MDTFIILRQKTPTSKFDQRSYSDRKALNTALAYALAKLTLKGKRLPKAKAKERNALVLHPFPLIFTYFHISFKYRKIHIILNSYYPDNKGNK